MANHTPIVSTLKATTCLLLLAISITCATSARIVPPVVAPVVAPESSNQVTSPVADSTDPEEADAMTPAAAVANPVVSPVADATVPAAAGATTPAAAVVDPVVTPVADATAPSASDATTPSASTIVNGVGPSSATVENSEPHHPLSFFMHDVLGGSNPSSRAVTGIVSNPEVNGQLAFAKPNGAVIPVNNGVPRTNTNNGIINNNLPFLTGLGGPTSNTLLQNTANNVNGGNGLPFLTTGQLPSGTQLQELLFGTMTVIDDELTEGHELGSAVVGKAQGFYVASSEDGTSQTMAFTAMFESGHYIDSISFFGVHRASSSESQIAIMGGTGKYVNAKGFATVKTIHPAVDQHATDGAETLLQFTVYLSY